MYQRTENGATIVIREHWHEWFRVYVSEGYMIPRFYLPIATDFKTRQAECWIFPVAPVAIFFIIMKRALWGIWVDLIDLAEILKHKNENN